MMSFALTWALMMFDRNAQSRTGCMNGIFNLSSYRARVIFFTTSIGIFVEALRI